MDLVISSTTERQHHGRKPGFFGGLTALFHSWEFTGIMGFHGTNGTGNGDHETYHGNFTGFHGGFPGEFQGSNCAFFGHNHREHDGNIGIY